ncbi:hypothetical protein [Paenibacillus terrigena]|uniref:hypothetical protein n=1 Tax=Paenibacillus terrigena TaxID=369333 RepID=UPI0028D3EA7F|nr:hypothetical protein [Paenibacillus terrigena]
MAIDNDNFKRLISEFQHGENRTLIDKILDYLRIRFDRVDTDNLPEHAMYIAFRINVILAPLLKTAKYNVDQGSYDPEDLWWYAKGLREDMGIEMTPEDGFKAVFDNIAAIRDMYGREVTTSLLYSIHCCVTQPHKIDAEIERIIDSLAPTLLIPALENAIINADTSRSEREIIRYINRVFQTEYIRLQAEENGYHRLGRRDEDGKFVNVYVHPKSTPVWDTVLGIDTDNIDVTEAISKLTALQRQTVLDMHEIIYDDFEREDYSAYKVNEEGLYEINNRRMAKELGLDETTLRKRRQSIRKTLVGGVA